ncbi:substrate-binding domain-containing protein [Bauldia sp.]|uniref:substrate-binding domain-containing protein n=1 Tax=Bauldia sp. TaxID=2575872 RepID=UPI003BAC7575
MPRLTIGFLLAAFAWAGFTGGAGAQDQSDDGPITIGVAMATKAQPRWTFDVAAMQERAEEVGAELIVDWAYGDAAGQLWQVETLINRHVDALIVVAVDDAASQRLVTEANDADIPIIAYDIGIADANIDYFLTRDNEAVGRLQVEAALAAAPPNADDPPAYALIKGDQSNPVARAIADVYEETLRPLADAGEIDIVFDRWHAEWSSLEARTTAEAAIIRGVDAFVASNDTLAVGVARALIDARQQDDGVFVSGLDADIINDTLIVEGVIDMTVWTQIEVMAEEAIDAAVALAKGEPPRFDTTVDLGAGPIPTALIEVVPVTADNMCEWILDIAPDGWATPDDVYGRLPRPAACEVVPPPDDQVVTIGVAMATRAQPRWDFDVAAMQERADEIGAELMVQWAYGDAIDQLWQVDILIANKVDALIVVAVDGGAARRFVERANSVGIPIVVYDIPVESAGIDYFVTRDNAAAAQLQVDAALAFAPPDAADPPRYALIKGDRGNAVAREMADVYDAVLGPLAEAGEIEITTDRWHADWSSYDARQTAEIALIQSDVDAFVVSNDTLALGVAGALHDVGRDGEVFVSGLDADIPNDQLIVEGTITMTVWTEIERMAREAVDAAVAMASGNAPLFDAEIDTGYGPVPTGLIEVVPVDADTMCDWILDIAPDGWVTVADVYVRVPPPPPCDAVEE